MRGVLLTMFVLLATGYVASHAGRPTNPRGSERTAAADDGWRRTSQGWERRSQWHVQSKVAHHRAAENVPHPISLAIAQVLAVIGLWLLTTYARKAKQKLTPQNADEFARTHAGHPAGA